MPKIETDIDAAEVVLMLAPETNGHVAVKAWEALGRQTGRDHTHLALPTAKTRRSASATSRRSRARSSPRPPGGHRERNRLLQRRLHQRARADPVAHADRSPAALPGSPVDAGLRRGLCQLPPAGRPEDHKPVIQGRPNGNPEIVLNFITPHQKWGIHSTYTDNLLMLTLSAADRSSGSARSTRRSAGIVDNDWVEAFNINGALVARAVGPSASRRAWSSCTTRRKRS
jgi:nitrate reductase alpha subunit